MAGLPFGTSHVREVFRDYKRSAKKRGIPFKLSMADFRTIVVKYCHYCGAAPSIREYTMTKKKIPLNGVDRVNSDLGYTMSNCVPACKECNMLKSTRTLDEFLDHIRRVYEHTKDLLKKT